MPTKIQEVLVLGTYRTFETAEDSANNWRSRGIEVEIAQPERWQVWAKRDVYNTPLLRRWLFQDVEAAGKTMAYLDTKVLEKIPRLTWTVNGNRYSYNYLEISTEKNLIEVRQGEKPENIRFYPGKLNLQPNAYNTYTLVNQVPLESYLRGVVPHEIGANPPAAAVEAQAVIARTYALRNLRRFAIDNYQLCADTHCQVYYGIKESTSRTDKAINNTKGMVLTYKQELIDALYSSTTGGVTAYFSDVWDGEDRPYLRPVVDSPISLWDLSRQSLAVERNFRQFIAQQSGFNESKWNTFRWRRETSVEDITNLLQKFLKIQNSPYANFNTVKSMSIVERSQSGRILKMAVETDIGTVILEKDEIRSAFAAPISTLFYIEPLNKGRPDIWGYAFVGGGFGHGVGLSQTGAQNLAQLGWSNPQILQFYYPGAKIQLLGDSIRL